MRLFSGPSDYHKQFDAIVVGTGLTGGWVAKALTEAGLEILLLDAGLFLPPATVNDLAWWARIAGTPTVLLVDSRGIVKAKFVGRLPVSGEQALLAMLATPARGLLRGDRTRKND